MTVTNRAPNSEIRLAELMASLSMATDMAMGQPLEFALCSCVLAVRLGDALGWDESALRAAYYQALLRYIGCNAGTHTLAALFGDEIALRTDYAAVDPGRDAEVLNMVFRFIRQANAGMPPLQFIRSTLQGMLSARDVSRESFAGHCEVAERLAERLGFDQDICHALGQLYERWDGKGAPNGLKGDEVAPPVLLVILAQDAVTFFRLEGVDAAVSMVSKRSGSAYEPHMAEVFCQRAHALLANLDSDLSWNAVLSIEPGFHSYLTESQLDTACEAIADFADIKSPYFLGHSRHVADLASEAGRRAGLPESDVVMLRRAGYLHDVGKVGVSTGVWDKPGALSDREWEQVRLHPYYTERVFSRPAGLAELGKLASLHHERMDGSGYHRGLSGAQLSPTARVLITANAYCALVEQRPHRDTCSPDEAAITLKNEVRAGHLDGDAVNMVLAAAGHTVRPTRRDFVSGLSEREIEVLRLVARGQSMREIAGALTVSPKTVDNHIQHIYAKIGVSTRSGATLFAMENNLLTG
jgi:HD-GYP domain-containing protein (c-di-GMP phosphodiesterase class II)/DNA-binding CsgD family transcriptional regulator